MQQKISQTVIAALRSLGNSAKPTLKKIKKIEGDIKRLEAQRIEEFKEMADYDAICKKKTKDFDPKGEGFTINQMMELRTFETTGEDGKISTSEKITFRYPETIIPTSEDEVPEDPTQTTEEEQNQTQNTETEATEE